MSKIETQTNHFHGWTNYDNISFYETITLEAFQRLALIAGLANCCDLTLIQSYISKTTSILEVGAGYGRVINHLIEQNFSGKISAIERSNKFYKILSSKYHNKAKILQMDIHDLDPLKQKFGLVLWMWSGMADFAKSEQPLILSKLMSLVKKDGFLIFDTLAHSSVPLNAIYNKGQEFTITSNGDIANQTYSASLKEIETYATKIGYKKVQHIEYKTDTGRTRFLHIIHKN